MAAVATEAVAATEAAAVLIGDFWGRWLAHGLRPRAVERRWRDHRRNLEPI